MKMLKTKKGSFGDMLYLSVVFFIIGLFITMGWLINSKVNEQWQNHDELGTESQAIMQQNSDRYVATWDGVFLVVLVGGYLAALLLAYNVDINPVFFFLSLLIMGVVVVITAVLGNAWYTYANTAGLSSYVDDFTIIPFVMGRYVEMLTVMTFGLAGVMYAKTR